MHAYSDVQMISEEMQSWNRLTGRTFPPQTSRGQPIWKKCDRQIGSFPPNWGENLEKFETTT